MKRLTFGFLVALLVLFTGCSQKDVEVTEETKTAQQEAQKSAEETTQESVESQTQTAQTNSADAVEQAASTVEEKKDEIVKEVVAPMLDNIYFDYDKFAIKGDMRSVIKANYKKLDESTYSGTITLEGHCDERGSNEYNFALGLKRAQSVKSELIEYGVNPSQIKIMSFGENKPLCTKQTEDCWAKNRRVETILD